MCVMDPYLVLGRFALTTWRSSWAGIENWRPDFGIVGRISHLATRAIDVVILKSLGIEPRART